MINETDNRWKVKTLSNNSIVQNPKTVWTVTIWKKDETHFGYVTCYKATNVRTRRKVKYYEYTFTDENGEWKIHEIDSRSNGVHDAKKIIGAE